MLGIALVQAQSIQLGQNFMLGNAFTEESTFSCLAMVLAIERNMIPSKLECTARDPTK